MRIAIMKRSELANKFRKQPTEANKLAFRKQQNHYSRLYKRERRKYYENFNLSDIQTTNIFGKP